MSTENVAESESKTSGCGNLLDWLQSKMRKDRNDRVTRFRWKSSPTATALTIKTVNQEKAEQTIEMLYAQLDLPRPTIIWFTSPLALILAAIRCTHLRGSWLSTTVPGEIKKVPNPIVDLIRAAMFNGVFHPDPRNYGEIGAASAAARTLARHSISGVAIGVSRSPRTYLPLDELLPNSFSPDAQACIEALDDSMRESTKMHRDPEVRDSFTALSRMVGGFICFEHVAFVVQSKVIFEELREIHNGGAPILQYPDSWSVYAIYGKCVPEYAVRKPEEIRINDINREADPETRFFLLEKYGMTRYWRDLGAREQQKDEFGTLFQLYADNKSKLVRVINSTPEPDGSYKEYFLRVPPSIKTAREAVAWTFGMQLDQYRPRVET